MIPVRALVALVVVLLAVGFWTGLHGQDTLALPCGLAALAALIVLMVVDSNRYQARPRDGFPSDRRNRL